MLSVVGQRLKNLYVNYDIYLTTKIIFLILYLRIKNHAIHYCSKLPKNNNDGKMNDRLNTSFSIDDPVIFVTVTIFSMTSREALRSPALISMVDMSGFSSIVTCCLSTPEPFPCFVFHLLSCCPTKNK